MNQEQGTQNPTRLFIDPANPSLAAVEAACVALKTGALIIMPTETVYGIAADPANPDAMKRLYKAKGRVPDKPVARLVDSLTEVEAAGARVGDVARALAHAFWPGPLTLVLPVHNEWHGFRVPDHPVALAVLRTFAAPLAVSSANRAGTPDALTADEAIAQLGDYVERVLDSGPSVGTIPSTVARIIEERVEILRAGAITTEAIMNIAENGHD